MRVVTPRLINAAGRPDLHIEASRSRNRLPANGGKRVSGTGTGVDVRQAGNAHVRRECSGAVLRLLTPPCSGIEGRRLGQVTRDCCALTRLWALACVIEG